MEWSENVVQPTCVRTKFAQPIQQLYVGSTLVENAMLNFLILTTTKSTAQKVSNSCQTHRTDYCNNPLPDMPILGFSNSAANKDMMEKNRDKWGCS